MALKLTEAIHTRWSATAALDALLPAARLTTGLSAAAAVPMAVVAITGDRPVTACNDGSTIRTIGLRFQIFHSRYDAASAIVDQLAAAFDQAGFALPDGNRVMGMARTNGAEQQQNDGMWQMIVEFDCMVYVGGR